jgi:chromosome partitioning protein
VGNHGAVSLPEEDFAERSRSIFEQLRAAQQQPPADPPSLQDETEDEPDAQDAAPQEPGAPLESDDSAEPIADISDATTTHGHAVEPVEELGAPPAEEPVEAPAGAAEDAADEFVALDAHAAEVAPEPSEVREEVLHRNEPVEGDDVDDVGHDDSAPIELHAPPVPWGAGTSSEPSADLEDSPADALPGEAEAVEALHELDTSPAVIDDDLAYVTNEDDLPSQELDVAASVMDPAPPTATAPLPDPQRFVRPLPRVIAIANQKGGVGKTTTTVNLGASLAVLGYRTLVIDLDPQGNATTGLGINSRNLDCSIYDVILHDTALDDCIEPTTLRNLFVAPATIDLAGAEIELVPAFSREQRLKRALEEVKADYEFVLIDCPPSLGLLTVNALSAATEVVVPIQCEYYALEGLGQLLRNVNLVQSNLNPDLELSAIVLTMYDARTKLAEQVADEVREHFGDRVCRNVVPRTVRLSEAPSFGQPIIVFDPSSRGALAYRELAREVSGGPPQRTG